MGSRQRWHLASYILHLQSLILTDIEYVNVAYMPRWTLEICLFADRVGLDEKAHNPLDQHLTGDDGDLKQANNDTSRTDQPLRCIGAAAACG